MSSKDEMRLLRASAIAELTEVSFQHPLNANSGVHMRSLGAMTGLQRIAVTLSRIPAGKESFIYHSHQCEEEFLYILSGRGIAEIGDETFEVGPGDFMGFPTPSVAHNLRNPFEVDIVYLMGGEHRDVEIADFPHVRKRLFRNGTEWRIVNWDDLAPFWT